MTNQTKSSSHFKHKRGFGKSLRTKMYGDYMHKKNNGLISKEINFETYCKQLIKKENA